MWAGDGLGSIARKEWHLYACFFLFPVFDRSKFISQTVNTPSHVSYFTQALWIATGESGSHLPGVAFPSNVEPVRGARSSWIQAGQTLPI